jgi:uncharacterized protein (TIGR03435 family)
MSNRIAIRLNYAKIAALITLGVAALAAPAIRAQTPSPAQSAPGPTAKFEVASIRPCKDGDGSGGGGKRGGSGGRTRWSPGRLNVECATLEYFIRDAYLKYANGEPWPAARPGEDPATGNLASHGLPPISDRLLREPIKGMPAWGADRYTIDVKAEGSVSQEMMRGPMMQALLEERFKLKIHRESTEIPVYELTVAKGGAKLQPFKEGSCVAMFGPDFHEPAPGQPFPRLCGGFNRGKNGGTDVPGTTIGNLCRQFSVLLDRDVVDKTGIAGMFDVHLDTHPAEPPADIAAAPGDPAERQPPTAEERAWRQSDYLTQFRAALPKLGLKLDPAKGLGVFLVVDHIEKPSEN